VTSDEARAVLGVPLEATVEEIRTAFRDVVRRHHPDVAGTSGSHRTRQAIAAYRLLQTAEPETAAIGQPSTVVHQAGDTVEVEVEVVADTVWVGLPAHEAFFVLLEVGHDLGEVAYVDRSVGLLEIVVTFLEWPVCSVVLWLRGRGSSTTDALCTVESLTGAPAPPASAVAGLIAGRLRDRRA
jgi:hypothetical protein